MKNSNHGFNTLDGKVGLVLYVLIIPYFVCDSKAEIKIDCLPCSYKELYNPWGSFTFI